MIILGIDPGASGALAFFHVELGHLSIVDMPTVQVMRGAKLKAEVSPQMLANLVGAGTPHKAIVEKVGAMPGQGVSSMFQFGRSVGVIEGVLAALRIPVEYVAPQKWQREMNVRAGDDGSRQRVVEVFPGFAALFARKKDHGRADAALMAAWGAMNG